MDQVKDMNPPVDFILYEVLMNKDIILPKELENVDVFLSSGYNAKILKQITDKPVININISTYDILMALSESSQFDEKPVVLIYENDFSKLNRIRNILKIEIIQDSYTQLENVEQMIMQHKQAGRKSVIGSGMVCSLAEKHNMIGTFVFPQESIRTFIQIAADMAATIRKEVRDKKQLSSVINYSNRGIVFTDHTGKIFVCNPLAATFFQDKPDNIIGRKIQSFFPDNELKDITKITETEINIMAHINGRDYVVNVIPIFHKEELVNILLYIDDIHFIQKTDQHIRENLPREGFIAKHTFDNYNSASPSFKALISTAKKFALNDESIVISGETGTGKEVLAQSIHNFSNRSKGAFVPVNCSAISPNLLESELFGYDEGAFTGAKKGGKKGLFEMAHLGTVFLDEIGELDLSLQTKLLRVIQEKEVMHVGGSKMIPFDTRIIAATNKNLWDLVQKKEFREDLYYRLNVLEINLIPLKEHKEDIYILFKNFLAERAPQILSLLEPISAEIDALLRSYKWPGNVRELENFTKLFIASLEPKNKLTDVYRLLNDLLQKKLLKLNPGPLPNNLSKPAISPVLSLYHDKEMQKIIEILDLTKGNQSEAAKILGMSRVTLWRKLKNYQPED
jgi:propionate catabolism operon transcriptional regulator